MMHTDLLQTHVLNLQHGLNLNMDLLCTESSYMMAAGTFAEIISFNEVSDLKVQQHSPRTGDKYDLWLGVLQQ